MTLRIELNGVQKLPRMVAATDKQLRIALVRALNKTIRWTKTRVIRALAKALKVPQISLKPRIYQNRAGKELSASIWLGTYAIPLYKASRGKAVQTRGGVRVRGETIKGAFIARMSSGHTGIFKRSRDQRLPIAEQMLTLDKEAEASLKSVVSHRVQSYFTRTFEHELDYVMGAV